MKRFAYTWVLVTFSVVMGGCSAAGASHGAAPATGACEIAWRVEVPTGEAPAGAIVVPATAARSEIEAMACAHGATAILASPVGPHLAAGRRTFVVLRPTADIGSSAMVYSDAEDGARELARDEANPDAPTPLALVDVTIKR